MAALSYSGEYEIKNKLGLHARPASLFVQKASGFDSDISVSRIDGESANGKSLMSMLVLSAVCGTKLLIRATGPDAKQAVLTLGALLDSKFDEE